MNDKMITNQYVDDRIHFFLSNKPDNSVLTFYQTLMECIDMTLLNEGDNEKTILEFCNRAIKIRSSVKSCQPIASVCIFPKFVHQVSKSLEGSEINISSVAGNFPTGNDKLENKKAEVKWALDQGAQEIDYVIYKPHIQNGQFNLLYDEIDQIKSICKQSCLKIILEVGELIDYRVIYQASRTALEAGADFIKTSTGKTQIGATLQAAYCMIMAIEDHYHQTNQMKGLKISGGIASIEQAIQYCTLVKNSLTSKWLHKDLFRIGTSTLIEKVLNFVE